MFKVGLISFDEKKNYKKEEILSCITQEDIFRYYLGIEVQYKRTFKNPLRVDNHGTCGFYRNNNTIRFYDKSRTINEDCFGILNHISNLSTLSLQEKLNKNYPDTTTIQGGTVILKKGEKIGNIYWGKDELIELYCKKIDNDRVLHMQIMDCIKRCKDKGIINFTLRSFIFDSLWETLLNLDMKKDYTSTISI